MRETRNGLSLAISLLLPLAASGAEDRLAITPACEEALALSALPARLRADASVYILIDDGYELSRKGDGPFTCIVERNHRDALIPQCPDIAGVDSVIPGIMKKTELALKGATSQASTASLAADFASGKLKAPERPGISWMISNFSYAWNDRRNGFIRIPPHVMFYAPGLSNDDVGGSFEHALVHNRGVPFIVDSGPHGYITSFVEKASDSSDVLQACEGQLPDEPPTLGESQARR